MDAVENIVHQFHDVEIQSDKWRYSADGSGSFFKIKYKFLDLKNLKDVMEGIDNFFSGADGQLSHV